MLSLQRVEDEKRAEEAMKRSKEEAERSKEDEERRKREEELAAAAEADRLALEELQKEGDKAIRNVLLAQREEDMALRGLKEAEDALKAAKNAEDMVRIKEASERKAAEDMKVKAARMYKRLAKAIQQREAELLLKKLKRLEFLKRQVMELKPQTITELKSYSWPPSIVKHVMTTTFLILGHQAKDLKQWNQLVVLMGKTGKEGLKRRVQGFEPDNMPHEVAEICAAILEGLDVGTVSDVSACAAAFFVWCDGMIVERLSMPKVDGKEGPEQESRCSQEEIK